MPLASELICLAITPYCHQYTMFSYSFEGSYKAPFYAGNIKDFIRNSRTPTLKNELPFLYVFPPCFKRSPLPHLSLRWTGLTCGTWRHHSIIMEDKTCAKNLKKNPSTLGMNQTRTQFFLFEESLLSIFNVVTQERLVSPSLLSPFWYCRLPCFNVLFLSFFGEPLSLKSVALHSVKMYPTTNSLSSVVSMEAICQLIPPTPVSQLRQK